LDDLADEARVIGLARRRAKGQSARPFTLPAPMGSINTVSSGAAMPPEDCIFRYNLIPGEYGLRVRLGSREWVTGLDGPVLSQLPFTGSTASASRLFATTRTGIWDVTSSTAAPVQVLTFGTQDGTSGHGVSFVFSSAAGHFLCYFDEANGYHVYAETGATWTAGGPSGSPITGVDPANLVAGIMWKRRLWAVERGTGKGWYLGTNALGGATTEFNFGAQFKQGGALRGLYSWTLDGGAGIDDTLVAISDGGDVAIYQGTDPATPGAFGLRGVWSVGGIPLGRRVASDFGGDLLVMSTRGILSMREIVDGVEDTGQYRTSKIANLWNKLMLSTANLRGWSMALHPLDATLIVTVPTGDGLPTRQLAMSLFTKGWSEYRDLGMGVCSAPYGGTFYYGTPDGKVKIMDGYVDGVTLADPDAYAAIQWSLLTAFQNLGSANQKQIGLLEPSFISEGAAPTSSVEARYRYDLSEIGSSPGGATNPGLALWDSATWDNAVWAPEYSAASPMFGTMGMGPEMALAIRGTSVARTILVGFRGTFTEGGFL
jgi:hypothetical protein